ncbi:hypothetical protein [Paenibacillus tengchongensis]|uniref:hypothetical protein n=1 Tax=Paenibacillus tengchongensis TaxID=2608684 RepID=UPI00124DFE2F|nr:hypothetical protein [Paenibacillus tengchongensis]
MKNDKEAPLDGRGPGAHPIPEPDSGPAGDVGATGKLEEIVGAMQDDEAEVTAPGISPDNNADFKNS